MSRERPERLLVRPVEAAPAVAPDPYQSGPAEHREMLRNGAEGDVECPSDVSGGTFLVPDQPENLAAARLGDGLQGVHRTII